MAASLCEQAVEREEEIHISSSALSYVFTALLCRDKNEELDDGEEEEEGNEYFSTLHGGILDQPEHHREIYTG